MPWIDDDLAETIAQLLEAEANVVEIEACFDEADVIAYGTQNAELGEFLGMNLAEALAMIGVETAAADLLTPRRRTRYIRKHCPVCQCGVPTVYVDRRRIRSANVDFTIGQWSRRSFVATDRWVETSWVCRNQHCSGYRELSEGTASRSLQGIAGWNSDWL